MRQHFLSAIDHLISTVERKHPTIILLYLSKRGGASLQIIREPPIPLAGDAMTHDAFNFVLSLANRFLSGQREHRSSQDQCSQPCDGLEYEPQLPAPSPVNSAQDIYVK